MGICQICIQTKCINNDLLRTELLNCPEWDLGPKDILQMDILPKLPLNGCYDHIITAIDVFENENKPKNNRTSERTHASVKTRLKAAKGEFRNNWHKYISLAVINHNTTYHASLGCEPSRVFHGRIPHNVLDYKLE